MTTSSQVRRRHLASPITVVRFPQNMNLAPLTTTEADLAADVERLLQSRLARPLTVTIHEDDRHGTARHNGRLVTTFQFAPLGAHVFPLRHGSQAVAA